MNTVFCDGGLCNRLNSLIFGLILREKYGDKWSISWPLNNWCGAPFDELFICDLPVNQHSLDYYKNAEENFLFLIHEDQLGLKSAKVVFNNDIKSLDQYGEVIQFARKQSLTIFYYHNSLPGFLNSSDVSRALELIQVRPEISCTALNFIKRHRINSSTIGIHIRKSDFGQTVDDETYFQIVKATKNQFFVCSDDPGVNRRFASLSNCHVFEKRAFPVKYIEDAGWQDCITDTSGRVFPFNVNRNANSVVDGLIDLLILSRTKIVLTSNSSFLATAKLFNSLKYFDSTRGNFVMNEAPVSQADLFEILNVIRPWNLTSDVKVRIGPNSDGGYVMPATSRMANVVISIGIGEEAGFDVELASLGAKVFQFDHTIDSSPVNHPNISFYRKGWGSASTGDFLSLSSMMAMVEWNTAIHPVLKFDVEGAEWDCLTSASSADLEYFEVIAGEFHDFDKLLNREHFASVKHVFEKLYQTHRVIHLHANNNGGILMIGGIPFPRLLELTWMRRSSGSFGGHSNEPIPGPFDRPNVAHLPDIHLRSF